MIGFMGWGKGLLCTALFVATASFAADSGGEAANGGKVRYRGGKEINFEKLLIEGQLKRKEISVVTGNAQDGTDGLLRLRENFLDRVAMDVGEEVP